jgi:hypothetical protein
MPQYTINMRDATDAQCDADTRTKMPQYTLNMCDTTNAVVAYAGCKSMHYHCYMSR